MNHRIVSRTEKRDQGDFWPLEHYTKSITQGGDAERYGELNYNETIFAAYDKAKMRRAKILGIASSDFVQTSKSLFWPDVIMLAATDLDWMQSLSMAIGV